jgi:hypothetical protein
MSVMPPRRFYSVALLCVAPMLVGCETTKNESEGEATPRVGFDVWPRYAGAPDRIASLMQPRSSVATTFKPTLSDEITKIYDKLKNSAQVDPELFLTLMQHGGAENGAPTYDPRFGITREEYNLLMYGSHLRLKILSQTTVQITAGAEGKFVVRGLPGLTEVIVDAALQAISTPYGEVTRPAEFEAATSPHLTGPLVGYRWTEPLVAEGLRRFRIEEITLAQSQVDGAVWMILHIADTIDNRLLVDYFVRFDGPQEAE